MGALGKALGYFPVLTEEYGSVLLVISDDSIKQLHEIHYEIQTIEGLPEPHLPEGATAQSALGPLSFMDCKPRTCYLISKAWPAVQPYFAACVLSVFLCQSMQLR